MLQDIVDEEYAHFIELVATNRNLRIVKVEKLAEGKIYTGRQSQSLKLANYVGSKEFLIETAAKLGGIGDSYTTVTLSNNGFIGSFTGFLSNSGYNIV